MDWLKALSATARKPMRLRAMGVMGVSHQQQKSLQAMIRTLEDDGNDTDSGDGEGNDTGNAELRDSDGEILRGGATGGDGG